MKSSTSGRNSIDVDRLIKLCKQLFVLLFTFKLSIILLINLLIKIDLSVGKSKNLMRVFKL